jgi:hypothetical protein
VPSHVVVYFAKETAGFFDEAGAWLGARGGAIAVAAGCGGSGTCVGGAAGRGAAEAVVPKAHSGYGFSFEERSDKRLTEVGGRGRALGSLCFSRRTSLVVLCLQYRFTQFGAPRKGVDRSGRGEQMVCLKRCNKMSLCFAAARSVFAIPQKPMQGV